MLATSPDVLETPPLRSTFTFLVFHFSPNKSKLCKKQHHFSLMSPSVPKKFQLQPEAFGRDQTFPEDKSCRSKEQNIKCLIRKFDLMN